MTGTPARYGVARLAFNATAALYIQPNGVSAATASLARQSLLNQKSGARMAEQLFDEFCGFDDGAA